MHISNIVEKKYYYINSSLEEYYILREEYFVSIARMLLWYALITEYLSKMGIFIM